MKMVNKVEYQAVCLISMVPPPVIEGNRPRTAINHRTQDPSLITINDSPEGSFFLKKS